MIITSLPKIIWEEGRVAALSHTYAVKSPLVTMARPKFAPKRIPSRGPIPNPTTCLIPGLVRPMMPNSIRIRSAVFHNALYRPTHVRTDRPTDRPRESLTTIGRYATKATRPNNSQIPEAPLHFGHVIAQNLFNLCTSIIHGHIDGTRPRGTPSTDAGQTTSGSGLVWQ